MCGRFVSYRRLDELKSWFGIDHAACEVTESYNVAPSQEIRVIVRQGGETRLETFHWGLVPFWAKDPSIGSRLINARVETVSQKPSFRTALKKRRCLIPADGFYEWQGEPGARQPVYVTLPDGRPMAFAGLWEAWDDRGRADTVYRSCTILTTDASEAVSAIHDRMPVVLDPAAYGQWLAPECEDVAVLERILSERILTRFATRPVSPRVNTVRNNGPENIRPIPG